MRITVSMMLDPAKYGLTECLHCNGYGSSLKESAATCTRCGGSGLVLKPSTPTTPNASPEVTAR